MDTRSLLALATAATLASAAGCEPRPDERPRADPDANSGADAIRSGAVKIELNKISLADDVNFDQQDMTDWKVVELTGKPALLTVELNWDNQNSDLNVDAFDAIGHPIASSPGPSPGTTSKKIVAEIEQLPAPYYIRVTAPRAHDASVYTVLPKWDGDAPAPLVGSGRKSSGDRPDGRHGNPPGPNPGGSDKTAEKIADSGLQGRIVSSYKEGGGMVLHIDKGSAAGVKPGQQGTILEGPNSPSPLAGGMFTIESVVDAHRSIARTTLGALAKSNRVAIDVR